MASPTSAGTAQPRRKNRAAAAPEAASAPPVSAGKQAVVVIHGMGEQQPLDTLREFVETVYQRDPLSRARVTVPEAPDPEGRPRRPRPGKIERELNPVSIVPDAATGSAELRRITTHPEHGRRTDFYEFYWADIMDGTPLDLVSSWVGGLLLRSPFRVPLRIQVWLAWLGCWALALCLVVLGVFVLYPEVFEGQRHFAATMAWLAGNRGWLGWSALGLGVALAAFRLATTNPPSEARLGGAFMLALVGLVLLLLPAALTGELRIWASLMWAGTGWLFAKLVGPYFGDVVRYVRATPQTVEKRKQVRERGLQLLRGLHAARDADGQPQYDRIVVVGHSLGSIIAYDLLQHYWEEAGPTHHVEVARPEGPEPWSPAPATAAAMRAVDAFVGETWRAGGPKPPPPFAPERLAEFQAAQSALCRALKAELGWRITDLVTLGSPLVHSEFLAVDSRHQLEKAFLERRLSASPPRPDPVGGRGSMLYEAGARGPFVHFAAPFSAVRWTNIYDVHPLPLFGDIVSGPLWRAFGPGIAEHRVHITRPGWLPGLDRFFTHTRYWSWSPRYSPHSPPEHIGLLRRAIDMSGQRD